MKKYLLPEKGNFYKGNLHSHSSISDGILTPEEMKKGYKEQGYSVLCCADHNIMLPHHDLTDKDFLMLTGFEININEGNENFKPLSADRSCHICLVALDPDNDIQPCWHREKYVKLGDSVALKHLVKFDDTLPDFEREYTTECINEIIKTGREKGFFVTYNHPTWSMESYPDYMSYHNMNAMEIYNFDSAYGGKDENNSRVYDDMLRGGKRIYCIASDDNHSLSDRFGGFVMIKAEKLEYRTITKALEEGNFYASNGGPAINELWIEDDKLHITFEEAYEAFLTTGIRRSQRIYQQTEKPLTEATFNVTEDDVYIRITAIGKDGKRSYTNAYFIDQIL